RRLPVTPAISSTVRPASDGVGPVEAEDDAAGEGRVGHLPGQRRRHVPAGHGGGLAVPGRAVHQAEVAARRQAAVAGRRAQQGLQLGGGGGADHVGRRRAGLGGRRRGGGREKRRVGEGDDPRGAGEERRRAREGGERREARLSAKGDRTSSGAMVALRLVVGARLVAVETTTLLFYKPCYYSNAYGTTRLKSE
ncbi:hypothetical protein THAOC_13986, partial [Thalassiosira oceanica]